MNLLRRYQILIAFGLCICLLLENSQSIEDVRSRGQALRGFINVGSKKGDEVELLSSIGTVYGMKLFQNHGGNLTADICGYTVYEDFSTQFKVIDVKKETGEARLVLARDLDERKVNYSIEIAPHTCSSGRHLEKIWIVVEVIEPYKWKPEWKQPSYFVEAVEGKFYSPLLRLEVKDDPDGSMQGKVCRFKIATRDVPFEVDDTGVVINSEPLEASRREKWEFSVVAESCEKQSSSPLLVTVKVKPSCLPEWIGIPEKIEFSPHDGRKLLAPEAELNLCDNTCNISSTVVSIKLSTGHIGKGCDRDTYSLDSQRKLCGASMNAVDLLPSPSLPNSWTKNVRVDDGKESDEVFAFDGKKDSVEVSDEVGEIKFGRQFTIATWMKHDKMDEQNDGSMSKKENVLCVSDSEEMNRQHMALFLHRCHLVLLVRQEPDSGLERNAYAPAEWRWTLPEVCDGKWHHYTINVFDGQDDADPKRSRRGKRHAPPSPGAKLFVDGKELVANQKNPNMVNDFPLHRTKIRSTKMVVGGCWMGGMGRIRNHFKGYLAGLSILNNQNEPSETVECLTKCQEKLDFTSLNEMEREMTLSMNNDKTSITIGGPSLHRIEEVMRKIVYVNSRNFPTPGHRPITFETRAVCSDGKQVDVDALKSLLIVSRIERPLIVLKATTRFEEDAHQLIGGVPVFRGLDISTHSKSQADEIYHGADGKPHFMNKYHLDSCAIKVSIPLASHIEYLTVPEVILSRYKLKVKSSTNGIVVSGVDKLESYERLLSSVKYFNSRPSDLNQRSFSLICTELNGRYTSNQLEVSMGVIHKAEDKSQEPQAIVAHRLVQPVGSILPVGDKQPRGRTIVIEQSSSGSATGVVIVCVVCIGFIALLAAVGVSRIRNAQRHSRDAGVDDKQEMEWDNSALTITVNPMDQEGLYEDETSLVSVLNNNDSRAEDGNDPIHQRHHHHHHHHHHRDDDDDTDVEDDASCHDSSCVDDDDDEEEVQGKMKKGELEWDDSTLNY